MNSDHPQLHADRPHRCARVTWPLLLAAVLSGAAVAMEAPEPPVESQAAQRVGESGRLVDRLLGDRVSPVRSLDPAIFIELSPVTATEPAVRLPENQQDAE